MSPRQQLWTALAAKDTQGVHLALLNGADPSSAQGTVPPLGKAIRQGMIEACLALLDKGANIQADDQGVPLLELACGLRGRQEVVRRLLQQGAMPTHQALQAAARLGDEPTVQMLLQSQAPAWPGEEDQKQTPALAAWPATAGIPQALIDATLRGPATQRGCEALISRCVRHSDLSLLQSLAGAQWFDDHSLGILGSLIHAQWVDAIDWLLASGHCPVKPGGEQYASPLVVACRRLHTERVKTRAFSIIQKLITHGFSARDRHVSFANSGAGNPRGIMEEPAGLAGIRYSPDVGRLRLVRELFADPISMQDMYGENDEPWEGGGLAHLLVGLGDFKSLEWALRKMPASEWEAHGRPGLICVLLKTQVNDQTQAKIDRLLDLGASVNAPSFYGNNALRVLIETLRQDVLRPSDQKPSLETVCSLVEHLLVRGANPYMQGHDGKSAMDSAQELLPAGFMALMERDHLSLGTIQLTTNRVKTRL